MLLLIGKHLGTEKNLEILTSLYEYLDERIDIKCNTTVKNINVNNDGTFTLDLSKDRKVNCKYLIAAPGRSGAEWFSSQAEKLGIPLINNQVDIGVRVELPATVFEEITDVLYEAKLIYRTKQYGDMVRTFCMNPYGHVVTENVDGIMTVQNPLTSHTNMVKE